MSIGVIIASVMIYLDDRLVWADPLCTYLFSIIIICTTIPIFKKCIVVLMEGTPPDFDDEKLLADILEIADVEEVHDFHVWSITVGKLAMTVHIQSDKPLKTLAQVTDLCRKKYDLFHTTIQMEGFSNNTHNFKCMNDIHD